MQWTQTTQTYSPDWLSQRILDLRARAETWIYGRLGPSRGPIAASGICLAACAFFLLLDVRGAFSAGVSIHRLFDGYPLIAALSSLSYLAWCLLGHRNCSFFVFGIGAIACLVFSFLAGNAAENLALFALLVGSRALVYALFRAFGRFPMRPAVIACALFALAYLAFFIYLSSGWSQLAFLNLTRPNRLAFLILLPLLEIQLTQSPNARELFGKQLWFPPQLLYPIPTRLNYWLPAPDQWRMQVRGFFDLAIGFSLLFLYGRMTMVRFDKFHFDNPLDFLEFGLFCYIETYALSCGSISVPVGLARLWGFNLPDAYSLPLLAASPFERWRRWNTYFYHFFRWAVFLPLAKKFQSLFIAVMITFLVSSFFHIMVPFPETAASLAISYLSHEAIFFFLAHGLAVYLGLKSKARFFSGTQRAGWMGVFVTWLLMIGIHVLHRSVA